MTQLTKEDLISFEKEISDIYSTGKIRGPIHLSGGGEDWLIEKFKEIKKDDWVFTTYRSHYHALLKGISPDLLREKILKGESMHIMDKENKFFTSSIVAGHLPIALGAALALKMKKSPNKVYVFCGDMAAETGAFHECRKYALGNELPLEFIVEDNGLGIETPTQKVWGEKVKRYAAHEQVMRYDGKKSLDSNVVSYNYKRTWPNHGVGLWINFPDDVKKNDLYINEIAKAMNMIAEKEKSIFLGQTVEYKGSPIFGTLSGVGGEKKLELPVMEDTQMGMSTGLALEGYLPVSIFPRIDFMACATNQLVNHLDLMRELSDGQFNPKVIIRTAIGSKTPLYPGPQHCQDHTEAYRTMLKNIDVIRLETAKDIIPAYTFALESDRSTLLVEIVENYHK